MAAWGLRLRERTEAGPVEAWQEVDPARTALLLCDVWDDHWCSGAARRVAAMVPRMQAVVAAARGAGCRIIHAPSDTMEFYAGSAARERARAVPRAEPPAERRVEAPPLPIDDSDGGCDSGEQPWHRAWSRQHPGIGIDAAADLVTDDGREVYSCLRAFGLERVLLMGVHTNMCVLGRSFGIRQLVRWGLPCALVRDLTDSMYNPQRSPQVSHDRGTELVIEHIERHWCPSVLSADLLAGSAP